jgi:hypothetical protein
MDAHGSFFDSVGFPGLAEEFFGQVATYTPTTGDPVPDCDVVLTRDVVIQPSSYEATTAIVGDTLEALVAQVGTVNEGDTFTLVNGGAVYACTRQLENNGRVTRWVVHAD